MVWRAGLPAGHRFAPKDRPAVSRRLAFIVWTTLAVVPWTLIALLVWTVWR
jgi:hypothetical protein